MDETLVKTRAALTEAMRARCPDAVAWRVAALIDNIKDAYVAATIDMQDISSLPPQRKYTGQVVIITDTAISIVRFEHAPEHGEADDTAVTTMTRPLHAVRSITSGAGPLDTNPIVDDEADIPRFPPGWAKITFDDRESLRLPLDARQPLGDALRRIARVRWTGAR